jgi:hypothetical protein
MHKLSDCQLLKTMLCDMELLRSFDLLLSFTDLNLSAFSKDLLSCGVVLYSDNKTWTYTSSFSNGTCKQNKEVSF